MLTFAKGFLYKFCFALGSEPPPIFSYGQVQKWVTHEEIKVVEKVVHKTTEVTEPSDNGFYAPQEFSYEQPVQNELPAEIPVVESSPAPAPSETASTEESKEEKKEGSAEGENTENPEVAGGVIMPPQSQAPMMYAPQPQNEQAQTNSTEDRTPAQQIPLLPNSLPAASQTVSSSASVGSSGGSSASGTPNSGFYGVLSDEDVIALTSPIKASFPDEMIKANGLLCVSGGRHCDRRNGVSVHSLRWGMEEGLKKDVAFQIKSASNGQVEVDFEFRIQNSLMVEEPVRLVARPLETLAYFETKNSKNYRVIELKFGSMSVRGEPLMGVQAKLFFEITEDGFALSSDSNLSFSRSKVDLLLTRWEALAGNAENTSGRTPAQNQLFLIANELQSSIKLEKSP